MADEYVIRIVPDSVSDNSKGGSGGASSGLGGLGGKLGSILALVGIGFAILRPIMPMIKGLGKMIGEFLRPIAEVIMMLLAPILALMRPLLITFKALMAPFKQAAMVGIAAGQKLIAQGMAVGGEVGGELVSAGFQGSMQSASLMLSGFMDVLFTPLKSIEAFGIGDAITNAMATWESAAIAGVYKVSEKSALIDDIWSNIGDVPLTTIQEQFAIINTYVDEMAESVGGFTIEEFSGNLEQIQSGLDSVFAPFVEFITEGGDLSTYVAQATTIMEDLSDTFPATANMISVGIMGIMKEWQEAIDNMSIKEQASLMLSGSEALREQLEGIEKTTFGDKVKDVLGGIAHNMGEIVTLGFLPGTMRSFEEDKSKWINDVAAARKTVTDDYLAMFPTVGEAQKNGLKEMLTSMNLYMGDSLIPDAYEKGLTELYNSTLKAENSFQRFGRTVESIANDAADAARAARRSASSAASSASKARANASSSSLGALV